MPAIRAILTAACATLALASGAQAQGSLSQCRQINDDAARLKCYDALTASAAGPTADGAWEVTEDKSPITDAPIVSATLRTSDGKSQLTLRCRERKTEAAVLIRGFINCGTEVRVTYRIDQGQPVEGPWNSSSSCYLAVAPSPIPFIRSLNDQGKIYFRLIDHHGKAFDALFNVGKVSAVSSRLAQACEWDSAASGPAKAAPK